MSIFKHVVETELKFVTRNGKRIEDTTRRVENLGRGIQKTNVEQKKWDKHGKEVVTTTEREITGFQRFQMEQLGVMFAGMALNRAMSNLNATSREWLGIGELTSTMMGVTMLQSNMNLLNNGILPLFDALINLPPEAQKAIGDLSLGLEATGAVMMVGGQFALGISSAMIMLEKLGLSAATTKGLIKGLAGIGLLGLAVTLGKISIETEGGAGVLAMLGMGIATALGAVMVGASPALGIVLGVIAVSATLAWKLKNIADERAFKDANPFGVTDMPGSLGDLSGGSIPYKGTRSFMPNVNPDLKSVNMDNLLGGQAGTVINNNYDIKVADKREWEEMLRRNNIELVAQTRREART